MKRLLVATCILVLLPPAALGQDVCTSFTIVAREVTYNDEREPFDAVRAVAVTRTGNAVVAESDGNALKVFRADGSFTGLWGRTGSGPGEFRSVLNVLAMGDSVWVFDDQLRRGTFMRSDGTPGLMVTFRQTLPRSQTYSDTYPFGSGFVVLPGLFPDALVRQEGFNRALFRTGREPASTVQEIARPLSMKGMYAAFELPGNALSHVPLPTPQWDRLAPVPGGMSVVIARGEIQSSGRRFATITRIGERGDTLLHRRFEVARAPADKSYITAEFERTLERYTRRYPSESAARRALNEVWRVEDHFWPVAGLFVDNDGRIWLRTSPAANAWHVFNQSGSVAACIQAPMDVRLVAGAGTKVWGVRTDGDGVQYLERYSFRPR